MKRKITWLLCLLLTLALVAVPVMATTVSISLSAGSTTVNGGDKVTVTVSANVDSCGSGGIEVSYDSKVFELVSGECLLSGADISYFDASSKDGAFAFSSNTAISGKAFKFVLKVKDSASIGSSKVTVKFKADSTSASKSISLTVACAHKYDNSCDKTCNLCDAARDISHTWNSGKVTKKATCTAKGTKTYTCTVCGKTKTEDIKKTSHKYESDCDADCNTCGKTRTVTHSYEWVSDESSHWQKCKVCGDKLESAEHTFSGEMSSDASGHGYACTVCGLLSNREAHTFEHDCDATCDTCSYERTITHSYDDYWFSDDVGHWHECAVCGDKLETVEHTPGDAATETTDQICTDCGYILQVAGNHQHTMAGDWLSDDEGHWFLCICGDYADKQEHNCDGYLIDETAGTVTYVCTVCSHVKTEEYVPPATTPPTTVPTETVQPTQPTAADTPKDTANDFLADLLGDWARDFPWWIVAAVLAVLLLISVYFNVYLLRCLFASRKTGKYVQRQANSTPPEATPEEPEAVTEDSEADMEPKE